MADNNLTLLQFEEKIQHSCPDSFGNLSSKRLLQKYPPLAFSQSNSLFIAVPLLVAILGLLNRLACSVRLVVMNVDIIENIYDQLFRVRTNFRFQSGIPMLLFIVGSIAISFRHFGLPSSFYRVFQAGFSSLRAQHWQSTIKCIPAENVSDEARTKPVVECCLSTTQYL